MSSRAVISAAFVAAALFGQAAAGTAHSAPAGEVSNEIAVASEARLGGDEAKTRLIVDLSHKINLRVFTLANPFRVIIDMPQIAFQFPAKTGETGRGLIKAFRYGLVMQGGSRMVIDLSRPARVEGQVERARATDTPA